MPRQYKPETGLVIRFVSDCPNTKEAYIMDTDIRILNCGDAAVTVELGKEISPATGKAVKNLDAVIKASGKKGILETIPTFRSLTILYDPEKLSYKSIVSFIEKSAKTASEIKDTDNEKTIHEIPVCYEGEFAEDLKDVAKINGLSTEEVISIHTGTDYLIYMLGFLPGFAYLGGLDKRIETPRLETPRTKIPAGSVGIGGNQTGIYPLASPGGWRLIGKTPVLPFDKRRKDPILYKSGEYIRFKRIDKETFDKIEKEVEEGKYIHKIIKEAVRNGRS